MAATVQRLHDYGENPPPADDHEATGINTRTRHYRDNRGRIFRVEMTGQRAYDLIQYLEQKATAGQNYHDVSLAVTFAEFIRDQLRGQGF